MLFNVVMALGELAVVFPVQGSFSIYRFVLFHIPISWVVGITYSYFYVAVLDLYTPLGDLRWVSLSFSIDCLI